MGRSNPICAIDSCTSPTFCRGWCRSHYNRWHRYGDPLRGGGKRGGGPGRGGSPPREARAFFESAIAREPSDDCILWPHSTDRKGYGAIWHEGRLWGAHRLVCVITHGPPPSDVHEAAHSCGVRHCINPNHIRWATPHENQMDKHLHGTAPIGGRNHLTKLTPEQVIQIRSLGGKVPGYRLAKTYGVEKTTIYRVLDRKTWRWL